MAMLGRKCRLLIRGVEARGVRSVTIAAPCDGAVTTTVEFICGVTFREDGTIELDGGPQVGAITADGTPLRAISFLAIPNGPLTG